MAVAVNSTHTRRTARPYVLVRASACASRAATTSRWEDTFPAHATAHAGGHLQDIVCLAQHRLCGGCCPSGRGAYHTLLRYASATSPTMGRAASMLSMFYHLEKTWCCSGMQRWDSEKYEAIVCIKSEHIVKHVSLNNVFVDQ